MLLREQKGVMKTSKINESGLRPLGLQWFLCMQLNVGSVQHMFVWMWLLYIYHCVVRNILLSPEIASTYTSTHIKAWADMAIMPLRL